LKGKFILVIGLFFVVVALVALCAKHNRDVQTKSRTQTSDTKFVHKPFLVSPRQLVITIGNKKIPFIYKKKGYSNYEDEAEIGPKEEGKFEEDGLWQKAILMGEKCSPLEFSGAIHYDNNGNQLLEPPPRSPRASSL
ncbi:hypothetical protein CFOL_v3_20953, partial [Cephalotus follicularis]